MANRKEDWIKTTQDFQRISEIHQASYEDLSKSYDELFEQFGSKRMLRLEESNRTHLTIAKVASGKK